MLKARKSQRIVVDSLGFSFGVANFGFVEKRTFFLAQRLNAESLNLKSYKAQSYYNTKARIALILNEK